MECRIEKPVPEALERAKNLIAADELVAFPTETVYGLGGSALSERAIRKIYEAKGRPSDNPLIVHTWCVEKVYEIAEVTPLAEKLMTAFMPGPITLVLKRKAQISPAVSAGLDTVAVRVPQSEAGRKFLEAVQVPIAGPSANTSTRPSPTSAAHVCNDMKDRISLVIDGGDCEVGIESTVVLATGESPRILRPGVITKEMIDRVASVDEEMNPDAAVRSPGVKYKHYSPKCEVKLFRHGNPAFLQRRYGELKQTCKPVVLCGSETAEKISCETIPLGISEAEIAHNFYRALLEAEKKFDCILLEQCPEDELGRSVNNRMFKTGGSHYEEEET